MDRQMANDFVRSLDEELRPRVVSYFQNHVKPSEVDDLVQETFLRARRAGTGLSSPDEIHYRAAWLLMIARRVCADFYRTKEPLILVPPESIGGFSDEPLEIADDFCAYVAAAVDDLPDELTRQIFVEKYWQKQEYQMIADQFGLGVSSVKMRLHRRQPDLAVNLKKLVSSPWPHIDTYFMFIGYEGAIDRPSHLSRWHAMMFPNPDKLEHLLLSGFFRPASAETMDYVNRDMSKHNIAAARVLLVAATGGLFDTTIVHVHCDRRSTKYWEREKKSLFEEFGGCTTLADSAQRVAIRRMTKLLTRGYKGILYKFRMIREDVMAPRYRPGRISYRFSANGLPLLHSE